MIATTGRLRQRGGVPEATPRVPDVHDTRRRIAASVLTFAVVTILAGCGLVPVPTPPGEPGHETAGPVDPMPTEPGQVDPATVDLSALPDRIEVFGRLTQVMPGRTVNEDQPRSGRDEGFVILQTADGLLPIVLRLDDVEAGEGRPGRNLADPNAIGVVVAAPAGTHIPTGTAGFAALEALAAETGGALQVVGFLDRQLRTRE